jgi:ArsR family transcriptional regulator, arsenate/arsenite/antimonite-responsive transcriptional repressor
MKMDSSEKFEAYGLFFGTLANDSRLKIVNLLRKGKLNVSEICEKTGFEQSMVSHNMKNLEHHGMVFSERKGKYKYYSLNKDTIHPLLELIDSHMKEYCCKILRGER